MVKTNWQWFFVVWTLIHHDVRHRHHVVRNGSIIIFHLSKLWKAKFFILWDVIFLVRAQEKFRIDHSWEWTPLFVTRLNCVRTVICAVLRQWGWADSRSSSSSGIELSCRAWHPRTFAWKINVVPHVTNTGFPKKQKRVQSVNKDREGENIEQNVKLMNFELASRLFGEGGGSFVSAHLWRGHRVLCYMKITIR